jgi:clan AA aspartic protease (TIGR02281 family)
MSKHLKHLMYIIALVLSVAVAACTTQYQPQGVTGGDADAANTLQRGRASILRAKASLADAAHALQRGQAAYDRQDYATALYELRPLAQQGSPRAQNYLGFMYEKGLGVAKDYTEAVRWYRQAATQGNPAAQCNLGDMYRDGRGVAKDKGVAVRLYRQAAQQGNVQAHYNLGAMYSGGEGVTRDLVEGERWFAKAIELSPPGPQRTAAHEARERVTRQLTAKQVPVTQPASATPSTPLSASPPPPLITPTPSAPSRMVEEQKTVATPSPQILDRENISLAKKGGVYQLPVEINGVITLDFVLDTGAADVNIPADVALTLFRAGKIRDTDFLPGRVYTLADGSTLNSSRVLLRSLKIGNRRVTNVAASIGPVSSTLLLGQSFLEKLGTYGIDSQRQVLTIGMKGHQK